MTLKRRELLKSGLALGGARLLRGGTALVANWSTAAPAIEPSDPSKWHNGRLISYGLGASAKAPFTISGTDDVKDVHYTFWLEEAGRIDILGFDYSKHGEIVFCGEYESGENPYNRFIAVKPAGQKPATVVPTHLYSAKQIAVAPDGTIWTIGVEVLDDDGLEVNNKANIIRQFDRSGRPLASTLRYEECPMLFSPLMSVTTNTVAVCSPGFGNGHYLEIATGDLKVRKFWPGAKQRVITGFTLLESHQAFLTTEDKPYTHLLDRRAGKWVAVELKLADQQERAKLKGNEGGVLVFLAGDNLYFVDPLQQQSL